MTSHPLGGEHEGHHGGAVDAVTAQVGVAALVELDLHLETTRFGTGLKKSFGAGLATEDELYRQTPATHCKSPSPLR